MSSESVLAVYLAAGSASAVAVLVVRRAVPLAERLPTALLAVLLWPFLLPTLAPGEPVARPGPPAPHGELLDALARRLRLGWEQSGAAVDAPERGVVERFLAHLRASSRRLGELDQALPEAPASVRGRLTELRAATTLELEQGLALLEEVLAQLTLLRFVGQAETAGGRTERLRIEELLGRIEALAEVASPAARG